MRCFLYFLLTFFIVAKAQKDPITEDWIRKQLTQLVADSVPFLENTDYLPVSQLTSVVFKPMQDKSTARFSLYVVYANSTFPPESSDQLNAFCRMFRTFKTSVGVVLTCRFAQADAMNNLPLYEVLIVSKLPPPPLGRTYATKPLNNTNIVAFGSYVEEWFSKRQENCLVLRAAAANRLDFLTPTNYYLFIECGGSFNPPRPAKYPQANYVSVLNTVYLREQSLKLLPKSKEFQLSLVDVYETESINLNSLRYLATYILKMT
jgi:hypothetical protein